MPDGRETFGRGARCQGPGADKTTMTRDRMRLSFRFTDVLAADDAIAAPRIRK
jgi:hypothetical protein